MMESSLKDDDSMRQLITTTNQVAEILRGRRKARRLSQHELATKLGVSQARLPCSSRIRRAFRSIA